MTLNRKYLKKALFSWKAVSTMLFISLAAVFIRPVDYVDVWWHLAAGEAAARSGSIPAADIFSRVVHGRPWLNAEWLYDLVLFGLHSLWGTKGIVALKAALCLGIIFFAWRRLAFHAKSPVISAAFAALLCLGGENLWHDRSELVSVFFLSALVWTLESSLRRGRFPAWLWAWPFIFCAWANAHGMFSVGLVTGALWLLGALPGRPPGQAAAYSAWGLSCAAATLANPLGWRLHETVWRWSVSLKNCLVTEMQPTPPTYYVFWACLALVWLSFAEKWFRQRKAEWADILVCAAFSYFGISHFRGAPVFAVIALPFVLKNLSGSGLLLNARERLSSLPRLSAGIAAGALVLWGTIAAGGIGTGIDEEKSFHAREACDFIEKESVKGPFYNDYILGSYWVWRFKGNPGAFIDGRGGVVEGYEELLAEIVSSQKSPESWNSFLERYGSDAALVRYPYPSSSLNPPLFGAFFPRNRWALVYWDDICLVFLRRTKENAALIRKHEFRAVEPDATYAYFSEMIRRFPERRAALFRDLERNLALHPRSLRAEKLLRLLAEAGQKAE